MNPYRLLEQYPRTDDELPCATFKNLADAEFFLQHKYESSLAMKVNVKYLLYRGATFIKSLSTSDVQEGQLGSDSQGQGQSQSQSQQQNISFKPTPFNMSPRPAGMPPKWVTDSDDEDKNKK